MGTPKRQLIREALKEMLIDNTLVNSNVYSNRVEAYWRTELPAISIYTTEEQAESGNVNQSKYVRTMTLRVEIVTEASENLDNELDVIADQVEAIIQGNPGLNGTVLGSTLISTSIEMDKSGEKIVGLLTLEYELKYIK